MYGRPLVSGKKHILSGGSPLIIDWLPISPRHPPYKYDKVFVCACSVDKTLLAPYIDQSFGTNFYECVRESNSKFRV